MDEKWVRETAAGLKRDIEAKKSKDEKFVVTQRLKQELGPGLWAELRDWLKEACEKLNTEMGMEVARFVVVNGEEATVSGKADGMYTTMTAKFNPSKSSVEYHSQGGEPSRTYEVVINADGHAGLAQRGMPFGSTAAEVGKEILKHGLQVAS